ncbi:MAG: glycosyltransferase family 4 protein [Clostridia bacterium]|nr:glycosyltransferase family 4 protein [Clostridia bacterium]
MKIMVISAKNKTVFNFRGDLVKELVARGHEVLVTGPNQDFIEDVMALGVKSFHEVPLVKDNTGIMGDVRYMFKLRKVFKAEKPDMVFAYNIKPVVYGSMAARLAGVKKVVVMITGLGRVYTSNSLKTKVLRLITNTLYRMAFTCCTKAIFQNHDDLNQFVDAGLVRRDKTAHIDGSGVNMTRFHFDGLPEEHCFLMVGRIIREKGVMEYCKAAQIVREKHPEARCILLGGYDQAMGGLDPAEIKPYIDNGTIEFPGEVKDVSPLVKQCRYFVLPTYYREGVPRTILEAMAMARPVITTDWPGCRDAVQDGVNGLLTEPKNAEMLADKMCWMIEHPEEVARMSQRSIEICRERYDVNVVNAKMLKLLEV